jgi:hypothetical protein
MAEQLAGNAVAAASIPGVQFGASVDQDLNDFVSSFVCGAVQRGAPAVPQLSSAGEGGKVLSLRQQMEMHRRVEPCASCHKAWQSETRKTAHDPHLDPGMAMPIPIWNLLICDEGNHVVLRLNLTNWQDRELRMKHG